MLICYRKLRPIARLGGRIMSVIAEVPSVNFHLWKPCNMRCRFCFATFADIAPSILPKGYMERDDCAAVVRLLAEAGFEKINFAGGEPLLCPWLLDLLHIAKQSGMTTSVVTNGTKVDAEWLNQVQGLLDWAAVSIDTVDPVKLRLTGRTVGPTPITESGYLEITDGILAHGIGLKINTVVTLQNWEEDFTGFIRRANPERWKIFQVLPIAGQNDGTLAGLPVTKPQFDAYVARNSSVETDGIRVVPEDNELMTGSYVMVDPAGRFFDNATGGHRYSRPILEAGVRAALSEVTVDADKFLSRGGQYAWQRPPGIENL